MKLCCTKQCHSRTCCIWLNAESKLTKTCWHKNKHMYELKNVLFYQEKHAKYRDQNMMAQALWSGKTEITLLIICCEMQKTSQGIPLCQHTSLLLSYHYFHPHPIPKHFELRYAQIYVPIAQLKQATISQKEIH